MADTVVPNRTQSSRPLSLSKTSTTPFAQRNRSATVTSPATPLIGLDVSAKRRSLRMPLNADEIMGHSASTGILSAKERRSRRQSLIQPTASSLAKLAGVGKIADTVTPEQTLSTRKRHSFTPNASLSTPRLPMASSSGDGKPTVAKKNADHRTSWSPAAKRLSVTSKHDVIPSREASKETPKSTNGRPKSMLPTAKAEKTRPKAIIGWPTRQPPATEQRPIESRSTMPRPTESKNAAPRSTESKNAAPRPTESRPALRSESRPRPQPLKVKSAANEKTLEERGGMVAALVKGDETKGEDETVIETPAVCATLLDEQPNPPTASTRRSSCITLHDSSGTRAPQAPPCPASQAEPGYMRRSMCEACNRHLKNNGGLWSPRSLSPMDDGSHFSPRSTVSPTTPTSLASFSPPRRLKRQSCPSFAKRAVVNAPSPTCSTTPSIESPKLAGAIQPPETNTSKEEEEVWNEFLEKYQTTMASIENSLREQIGSEHRLKSLLYEHQALDTKGEELERRLSSHVQKLDALQRREAAYLGLQLPDETTLTQPSADSTGETPLAVIIQPPTPTETTAPLSVPGNVALNDRLVQLRWQVSRLFGGAVATGSTLTRYPETTRDHSIIMTVAGTGVTTERALLPNHLARDENDTLATYHYVTHITRSDQLEKLQILAQDRWVLDKDARQCQFQHDGLVCPTEFDWLDRRHHCRRCGHVVCQAHSANQLPLFHGSHNEEEWTRVCDTCFYSVMGPHLK